MSERLLQIGDWLKVNGDGIYGTRIWRAQHEGSDIDHATARYTKKGSLVYAFILDWPVDNSVLLSKTH
jgi:alpha-L-fucosidase